MLHLFLAPRHPQRSPLTITRPREERKRERAQINRSHRISREPRPRHVPGLASSVRRVTKARSLIPKSQIQVPKSLTGAVSSPCALRISPRPGGEGAYASHMGIFRRPLASLPPLPWRFSSWSGKRLSALLPPSPPVHRRKYTSGTPGHVRKRLCSAGERGTCFARLRSLSIILFPAPCSREKSGHGFDVGSALVDCSLAASLGSWPRGGRRTS